MHHPDHPAANRLPWFAAALLAAAAVTHALRGTNGRFRPKARSAAPDQSMSDNGSGRSARAIRASKARARERGRGRKAAAPEQIPWRGWKDIAIRSYHEAIDDRLFALAAGVVFYSLVALFPAIAAAVSVYAFFSDASSIAAHLSLADGIVPGAVLDIVRDEVTRIAGRSDGRLTVGFVIGFAIALWSANAGMKAIFDALNMIYDEQEKRGFIWLNLISLLFTIGAIAALLIAASAVVALPLVLTAVGIDTPAIALLRWPGLFVLVIAGLSVLYRYGPSRRAARWRWISVGSVFAALTWLAGSSLFSWYLINFANYNATYGALGAVVGLMMWMWLSAIVILVGAELNSEMERQTAVDSTDDGRRPLGERGATAADTVGQAQTT